MDASPTTLEGTAPALPRPRVLAVDDQLESLRLLKLRLTAAGLDCIECSSGTKALEYLQGNTADLIILDVMMPEMDGYELCRRIKADERLRDIPILFLTAKLQTEDKVIGLDAGAHDYLSKPVNQAELIARTRAALRVKYLQDQLKDQLATERSLAQLQQGMLGEHWLKTFGQLAGSLAHEINNPLTVALGSLDLLSLDDAMNPQALAHIQMLQNSLARAGNRLRSLLLIAQPLRGARVIELAPLINDIVTVVNSQVMMEKLRLKVIADPGQNWLGDPSELARALLYVLNNAIEAVSGRPDGKIVLELRPLENEHQIRVVDNGPGIPADVRGKIFDAFFTTKGGDHHGVGLFLANQILHQQNARLTMQSPATDGATVFTIHLKAG